MWEQTSKKVECTCANTFREIRIIIVIANVFHRDIVTESPSKCFFIIIRHIFNLHLSISCMYFSGLLLPRYPHHIHQSKILFSQYKVFANKNWFKAMVWSQFDTTCKTVVECYVQMTVLLRRFSSDYQI